MAKLPPPPKNLAEAKANFNNQLQQVGNYLIDAIVSSGVYSRTMTNIVDKWSKGKASPREQKQVVGAAMTSFGALIGGGTAYHGSPHTFEKFNMEKIGTGQGAQSYGHGLYFAENPEVAKDYARTLANERRGTLSRAVAGFDREVKDLKYLEGVLENKNPWPVNRAGNPVQRDVVLKEIADRKDSIKTLESLKTKLSNIENTYQVNIPDEHIAKMLDYDKPLSEQAPEVQKKLSGILENLRAQSIKTREGFNAKLAVVGKPPMEFKAEAGGTGKDIYEAVVKWFETDDEAWKALGKTANKPGAGGASYTTVQQAASEYLAKLGIPGIKYLDQGSRATKPWKITFPDGVVDYLDDASAKLARETPGVLAGGKLEKVSQTRNFVVFDENIIQNVKKQ